MVLQSAAKIIAQDARPILYQLIFMTIQCLQSWSATNLLDLQNLTVCKQKIEGESLHVVFSIGKYYYDAILNAFIKCHSIDCNKFLTLLLHAYRSVNCYDTCVLSIFGYIPLQTCVDSIYVPNVMSVTKDAESNVIIEIHPPAVGSNEYQLNKFCRCVHAMNDTILYSRLYYYVNASNRRQ